jgi:putative ABC transport system permease protein
VNPIPKMTAVLPRHVSPLSSMKATLAVRNLLRSRGRLWVSLFGIGFATFLMCVQGSLLYSFTLTASRVVDSVRADLWMIAKGTPTFDYVTSIPERYALLAGGIDGVQDSGRGASGWAPIQRANGDRTLVMIIGVEDNYRGGLPPAKELAAAAGLSDSGIVLDETDAAILGFDGQLQPAQVGFRRSYLFAKTTGFASFIGTPLVFSDYTDVRRFLRLERTDASFIVLNVKPGYDARVVRDVLRARFADVDVWTQKELSTRSRLFWLIQTGAGAALLLAGILGFGIGLVLVAQTIYSITAENVEEYATMKAMGASNLDVHYVVLVQSLVCGICGGALGLLLVEPYVRASRSIVTWLAVPWWMYPFVGVALLMLCVLASLIAARPAVNVDPGRVFRA